MSDEQEQEILRFKKRMDNNMNVQMELLADSSSFLVKILNLDSLDFFEQKIDESYINNHQKLISYFKTPKDLMKHLTVHYRDIKIQDGRIRFSIKFSRAVRPIPVTMDIKEKKMDKVELLNTKVRKMQEKFEEELALKEATIEQLRAQILKIKSSCEQSNKIVKNLLFYPYAHPLGVQNQYFSTNFTGKSIIVSHNHDGQAEDHIFVFNHEIVVGTVKSFTLKILHKVNVLCCCFGTELILSDNQFNGPEIVSYQTNGYINIGGETQNPEVGIDVGDVLQCELNLIENKINWIKDGNHFATTDLPQEMKDKSLYFALIFSCDQEKVEIILN